MLSPPAIQKLSFPFDVACIQRDDREIDIPRQAAEESLVDTRDGFAYAYAASCKDLCRYATKTSRRVISAHAKRFLEARAGMTFARHLEHRLTDAELPVFQRQQINAARHQIATEDLWRERLQSKVTCDGRETLGLDERDLPFSRIATVVIAFQPDVRVQHGFIDRAHDQPPLGPHADPYERSGSDGRIEEHGERGLWVERHK